MLEIIDDLKFKKGYKNILFFLIIIALVILGMNEFLLFHVLIELFSVFIAFAIFVVIYNSYNKNVNNYLVIFGVAFFFIGGFDLFHTLAYEGMNILMTTGANLAIELWIVARFFEAFSLYVAVSFFYKDQTLDFSKTFFIYTVVSIIVVFLIYFNWFPDVYIDGQGLTPFKIISEYVIIGILVTALYKLNKNKGEFNSLNYKYIFGTILVTIFSEIAFTNYIDIYGGAMIFGHLMKVISFYIVYKISVQYTIVHPQEVLNKRLKKSLERLELGINGANLGLWDWDTRTNEVIYNKNWANMLGYNLSELDYSLETWNKLMHPEDKQEVYKKLEAHFIGKKKLYRSEHRLKIKDGSYKWIRDIGKVVERDNTGEVSRVVGIHIDIDDEKRMYEQMKIEKAKFQQLFDNSNEGVALLDNDVRIIDINKKFHELFGYSEQEAINQYIDDLITPEKFKDEGNNYSNRVINGDSMVKEVIRQKKNGEKFYVSMHAFPITLDGGQIGIYAAYRDISERKKGEEYIKYLSFHDELTGLYNRRYFEAELDRLDRSRALPIGIIMGDLDQLKYINDHFGHATGDEYIKMIGEIISSQLRAEDIVARVGGDEFAIILPNADEDVCESICQRINKESKNVSDRKGLMRPLEISLGYAVKKEEAQTLKKIFIEADQEMYENKIAN